ncbi:MAG: hypothetical protein RLZ58_1459, partial [Pseudomonadota bacterium]
MPLTHSGGAASEWVCRFGPLVPRAGAVLDVACGSGRHLQWFAQRGHPVTGVDRDAAALDEARARVNASAGSDCTCICADIEGGPWPLAGRQFAGVVITH